MADQEFREFVDERWQDGVPPTPNEVAEVIKLAVEVTRRLTTLRVDSMNGLTVGYSSHIPDNAEIASEMLRRLEAKNVG